VLPSRNPNTMALLDKSLQISIVKTSVYDACPKFLKMEGFRVRSDVLIEKINGIPIKTFEHILASKSSKDSDKRMARVVKLAIEQYLRFIKNEAKLAKH
jgi:hypothetical protein